MKIDLRLMGIIALVLMLFGGITGYTIRTISESTPQVHLTTQQVHVTTQTIDPNTVNQYCEIKWRQDQAPGYGYTSYGTDSEYVQCSPSPIPGQGSYQP